jgi:hypothetical protein
LTFQQYGTMSFSPKSVGYAGEGTPYCDIGVWNGSFQKAAGIARDRDGQEYPAYVDASTGRVTITSGSPRANTQSPEFGVLDAKFRPNTDELWWIEWTQGTNVVTLHRGTSTTTQLPDMFQDDGDEYWIQFNDAGSDWYVYSGPCNLPTVFRSDGTMGQPPTWAVASCDAGQTILSNYRRPVDAANLYIRTALVTGTDYMYVPCADAYSACAATLWQVPITGGTPQKVTDLAGLQEPGDWRLIHVGPVAGA